MRYETTKFGQHTGKTLRRNPTKVHYKKRYESPVNEDDELRFLSHKSKLLKTVLVNKKEDQTFDRPALNEKVQKIAEMQRQLSNKLQGKHHNEVSDLQCAIHALQKEIAGVKIVYSQPYALT